MNKIFRIVFNTTTGRWVVASEMAKGRKKASASGKVGAAMAATLVTALAASGMASAGSVDGGTATGANSVAVGPGSTAADGGTAVGSGATSAAGTTAIGLNAVASGSNSVALGANSVATRDNTVSVGTSGAERQITNLASGTADTDAVNVAQLKGVTTALGGGAAVDPITGLVTAPTYRIAGADYNNVGDAFNAVDNNFVTNRFVKVNGDAVGSLYAQATGYGSVAMGDRASSGEYSVAIGSGAVANSALSTAIGYHSTASGTGTTALGTTTAALATQSTAIGVLSKVEVGADYSIAIGSRANVTAKNAIALGSYSLADRDNTISLGKAGTERQLVNLAKGTAATDAVNVSQLKTAVDGLGGSAAIDPDTGLVTGPTYNVTNVDGSQTTVNNVGAAITQIDGRTVQNTTAINNVNTSLNNGTIGPVQRTAAGQLSLIAAGGDSTAPGAAQVLSNVANGAVKVDSTDAVNGSQLFGLADSTAHALGGGSTVNDDGSIKAPTYNVGNTTVNNVGDAITNIDGRTKQNTTNIAGNTTAITNITNSLNQGTIGLVQQAGPGQKLTVGKGTDGSEVDFANNAGNARKLTRVAAGAGAEDAVNVSQLKGVTTALGGGATVDANGNVIAPSYTIQGQTGIADVGTALGKLDTATTTNASNITTVDGRVTTVAGDLTSLTTNVNNGTIGPVQRTAAGQLSLIAAGGDATAPGAAQVLSNVANGAVKVDSNDAVNGSQLFGLADSTAHALGGGSTVNQDGSINAPTYNVDNTTVNNVGDAITNIDGRTLENTTNIAGNTLAINNITNSINKGTVGLVQQAGAGQKLTVGKDTDGSEVNFANNAGSARRLTRVAAGASAEDAVNVSQLKTVVDGLGGGATIDPNTGLVTGPTYNVTNVDGSQTSVHNVGDAITNIDGRVYSNTTQITHLTNQITSGTVGLVQQAGPGQKLTVGKDTDGSEVSFTNAAGEARKLSGVADGVVAANSKDAVNGGQLHGVSQSMATALGGGSKVNADGSISSPTYVLTNADGSKSNVTGVEGAITNLDGRVHNNTARIDNVENNVTNLTNKINSGAVGLVQQAAPGEQLTVGNATDGKSVNFTGTAGDRVLTGVAAGKADNDAVNVGQLKASGMINAKGEAKVAVTYDSADKDSVTLGGAGAAKPVAMHNVSEGVADHDAVNVKQLNARLQAQNNTIIQQANSYTDDRFNKVKGDIDALRSDVDDRFHVQDARIDRLSAMSTAMASMTSSMSGVNRVNRMGVGAGSTNGRLAIAVGYQRAFRDGGATLTAGASLTDEDSTVGVGAGFGW